MLCWQCWAAQQQVKTPHRANIARRNWYGGETEQTKEDSNTAVLGAANDGRTHVPRNDYCSSGIWFRDGTEE